MPRRRLSRALAALAAAPLLALAAAPGPARADPLADAVRADMPGLLAIYRDLHAHPELSFQETRSAALLAAEARKAGFAVTTNVGRTGVVAVLKNGPGPVLLLRTDMDALPVEEKTGLPFASQARGTTIDGVETAIMHACGHDIHMTTWIAVARRMAAMKADWSGTLVMIAQPAEEIVGGAKAMLADGLFTRFPRPTHAIAFHDAANLPAGTIGYTPGYAMAGSDSVDVVVKGIGGHGAAPQTTKDPIVIAARIVGTLQTLVARELDPHEPAVVTVGTFHAGTKLNVIPAEATLGLSVRSFSPETRAHLLDGIARIARGEAIAAGLPKNLMPAVVPHGEIVPPTYNSPALAGQVAAALTARFGADKVKATPSVTASEDFGRYALADKTIQSLIFWVGAVPQAKWDAAKGDETKLPSLHSPFWAPDAEATIPVASEAMVTAALSILGKK